MIKLSINEKRAIYHMLILIMEADFAVVPEETSFIERVFSEFELTEEEYDYIDNIDFDQLKKEFANFSDEVKAYARNILLDMAKCDGYEDPRETELIEKICS